MRFATEQIPFLPAALTFSDASSLLVWMKAQQDRVTYPWISQTDFNEPGNVIFLNDFCDGALVSLIREDGEEHRAFRLLTD